MTDLFPLMIFQKFRYCAMTARVGNILFKCNSTKQTISIEAQKNLSPLTNSYRYIAPSPLCHKHLSEFAGQQGQEQELEILLYKK